MGKSTGSHRRPRFSSRHRVAGVINPLLDPILELFYGNGTAIGSNDDWKANQTAIEATGLQPSNDAESTILVSNLTPGAYTAILKGKNGGIGVGVLEVYVFLDFALELVLSRGT